MPTREQIESVLEEIERLQSARPEKAPWSELTHGEKFVALEEIEWAGFSRKQEMAVIGRILAGEAPELWMVEVPDMEPGGRHRPINGPSPITDARMGEIEAEPNGGVREALLADSHRLTHEIGFVGFRREFMNDPETVQDWPDSVERETVLREIWDNQADYAGCRDSPPTADSDAVMRYRDTLVALKGEPEQVQAEFYHRFSALGRSEREARALDRAEGVNTLGGDGLSRGPDDRSLADEREAPELWMQGVKERDGQEHDTDDSPVTGHELKSLADEIRRDEHAARVRDYGEADAATYEQRVREGADNRVSSPEESYFRDLAESAGMTVDEPKEHIDRTESGDSGDGVSVHQMSSDDDWMAKLSIDDESRTDLAAELDRIKRDTYVELEEQVAGWNFTRGEGGYAYHELPVTDREVLVEDYVDWDKYMERGLTFEDQARVMHEAARDPYSSESPARQQISETMNDIAVPPRIEDARLNEVLDQNSTYRIWQANDPSAAAAGWSAFPVDYLPAIDVEAVTLQEALELTEIGGLWETEEVELIADLPRSTALGDVIVTPDGYAHRVKPEGFGLIDPSTERAASEEPPLERVERQLRDWKHDHSPEIVPDPATGRIESGTHRWLDGAWAVMPEVVKLRVLEGVPDWSGVGGNDKESLLAREVDFNRITRDQLNVVFEEIGSDEIDERPARRLFDKANYAQAVANADQTPFGEQLQKVRPVTRNLIESVMLDAWPRDAAIVDFGIDSQEHYEALYYPIRNDEIAPSVLDAAMGVWRKADRVGQGGIKQPA